MNEQVADFQGRIRSINRIGLTRDLSPSERLRNGWKGWLADLQFAEFGTLTVAPIHAKNCRERRCDGVTFRGSIHCRLPGVQATATAVDKFRKLAGNSFVVEEFGSRGGRRHFHYLADGSTETRTGIKGCIRHLAGRTHKRCDSGWSAVGFWKKFVGFVDNAIINNQTKAIEYVTKDIADEDTRMWFG